MRRRTRMLAAARGILGPTLLVLIAIPAVAQVQRFHGGSLQKACVGPEICDPFGVGKARPGDTITCTLLVSNLDGFGDQLRVDSIIDVAHHAGGDQSSGNLLGAPVVLNAQDTAGDTVEVSHTDVVGSTDGPSLQDSATADGVDLGLVPPQAFSFPAVGMVTVVECCADADCNDQNACTMDSCNLETNLCVHTAGNAGVECRPSAGVCDVAELCTGASSDCPTDEFVGAGTVCRDAAGICDQAEVCTGTGPSCPTDSKKTSGTICRASAGACDSQEVCDGVSNTCPADTKSASGTVCRASTGVCDPQEVCDGTSSACPADTKRASGTVCRASTGVCDPQEVCDGASSACPADTKSPSGTVCRASTGACDPAEVCDGTSSACPADAKSPSGTVCRAAAGACDADEVCNGTSATCPSDAKKSSGTVCRSAAGSCDVQEVCNGTSNTCPADGFQPSTMQCRSSTGACDVAEFCPGTGPNCPADTFKDSGTTCRSSAGECDPPEVCTGTSPSCPADAKSPSGTACTPDNNPCTLDQCNGSSNTCQHPAGNKDVVCRSAAGECDVPELCTGTSTVCPANAFKSAGTPCTDTDGQTCTTPACDGAGTCNQGFDDTCHPGCRITGGGQVSGMTDPTIMADIVTANFGGQVGAPCGCIGCFDQFGHIQGNWTHNRKSKVGRLHAKLYNSLICDLDSGAGPAPPAAPANKACFSGVADYNPTNGNKTIAVAFRVEVEDRGEPGTNDVYRMRIWTPSGSETATSLSAKLCCTVGAPVKPAGIAEILDGGTLLHGNIQIHPQLKSSADGVCPKPNGVCTMP